MVRPQEAPSSTPTCKSIREADVAKVFPPDGWLMTSGTWGTDADHDTGQSWSGLSSVKFPSAGSNSARLRQGLIAVPGSYPVVYEVALRASATTAGAKSIVQLERYATDQTTLIGTTTLHDAELTSGNRWLLLKDILSVDGAYVRFVVGKDASVSHDLYLGSAVVKPTPRQFKSYLASNASLADSSTPSKIVIDTSEYDYGGVWAGASTYRFDYVGNEIASTLHKSRWVFQGQIEIQGVTDGGLVIVQIVKNGSTVIGEQSHLVGGTVDLRVNVHSQPVEIDGNDYVELYAAQDTSGSKTVTGGAAKTWLAGYEVTP